MFYLHHNRLSHLLAAVLVAIWPAGIAGACCCAADTPAGSHCCKANCCSHQPPSCCAAPVAGNQISGCHSAGQCDACGCMHGCEMGSHRRDVGFVPNPARLLAASLPSVTWQLPCSISDAQGTDASVDEDVASRPTRILYGVWRN